MASGKQLSVELVRHRYRRNERTAGLKTALVLGVTGELRLPF